MKIIDRIFEWVEKYATILVWLSVIGTTGVLVTLCFSNAIEWDESFTYNLVSTNNVKGIIEGTAADIHPPLYYLITKLFTVIFGNKLVVYKLASVAGATAAMILGPLIIRKNWGTFPTFLYVLVVGMGPTIAFYNVNLRMYSWALFFVTATALMAYEIIQKDSWVKWVLFLLFSLGGIYTFYFTAPSYVFIYGYLFISLLIYNRKAVVKLIGIGIAAVVGYIPWLSVLLKQYTSSGITEKNEETKAELWNICKQLFGGRVEYGTMMIIGLSLLAIIILWMFRERFETKEKSFILMCFINLPVTYYLSIAIAITSNHFYNSRYMVHTLGLFWVGIVITLSRVSKKVYLFLAAWLSIICLYSYKAVYIDEYQDQEKIVATMDFFEKNIEENDVIIFEVPTFDMIFKYYIPNAEYFYYENSDINYKEMQGKTVWFFSCWQRMLDDAVMEKNHIRSEYMGRYGLFGGAGVLDIYKLEIGN